MPPSASTPATRRFKGGGGSKALIVKGDLRNSITVLLKGDEAFIGILKSARSSSGGSPVNVAEIQEFGGPPVIIPDDAQDALPVPPRGACPDFRSIANRERVAKELGMGF